MPPSRTLILGAMPSEIVSIEAELTQVARGELEGYPYLRGRLGRRAVIVSVTGVGITAAAMTSALFIHHFRPSELVFTGSGARLNPELRTGDIIISARTSHHNAGNWTESGMVYRKVRGALKGQMTPYEFRPDPELLKIARDAIRDFQQKPITVQSKTYVPTVRVGRVCSGDVFGVTRQKIKDIREKLGADLIEMESSAAAQVCWQLGVPHLVIRSGSNLAQPSPGEDYRALGQIAAHQAARFTAHCVRRLTSR
jgi:5'-methylthioadenosine/S-adenosylhomocysteine nucleosidase